MTSSAVSPARVAYQRAKRGYRWLNEIAPGWRDRIDLKSLRMYNGYQCICGQVFRGKHRVASGYSYAAVHLFAEANHWVSTIVGEVGSTSADHRREAVSVALGFEAGSVEDPRYKSDEVEVTYEQLETAWVKLLEERMGFMWLVKHNAY